MTHSKVVTFRDLDVWRVAMDLAVAVYALAGRLPSCERFELSAQMRRAAVSIPANIAEGQGCGEDGRYIHHVRIALGSLCELATHLELGRRLALLSEADLKPAEQILGRTGQLLHGLLRSRRRKQAASRPVTIASSRLSSE